MLIAPPTGKKRRCKDNHWAHVGKSLYDSHVSKSMPNDLQQTEITAAKTLLLGMHAKSICQQVHIAYSQTKDCLCTCRQVIAQWTTNSQAAGAVAQYGTTSGQYTGSANATFTTYTANDMCGGEAQTTGYLFPGEPHCCDKQNLLHIPSHLSKQM